MWRQTETKKGWFLEHKMTEIDKLIYRHTNRQTQRKKDGRSDKLRGLRQTDKEEGERETERYKHKKVHRETVIVTYK